MTLSPGARLRPYELVAPLGSGGMSARGHAERNSAEHERGVPGARIVRAGVQGRIQTQVASPITIVQNWTAALKK